MEEERKDGMYERRVLGRMQASKQASKQAKKEGRWSKRGTFSSQTGYTGSVRVSLTRQLVSPVLLLVPRQLEADPSGVKKII